MRISWLVCLVLIIAFVEVLPREEEDAPRSESVDKGSQEVREDDHFKESSWQHGKSHQSDPRPCHYHNYLGEMGERELKHRAKLSRTQHYIAQMRRDKRLRRHQASKERKFEHGLLTEERLRQRIHAYQSGNHHPRKVKHCNYYPHKSLHQLHAVHRYRKRIRPPPHYSKPLRSPHKRRKQFSAYPVARKQIHGYFHRSPSYQPIKRLLLSQDRSEQTRVPIRHCRRRRRKRTPKGYSNPKYPKQYGFVQRRARHKRPAGVGHGHIKQKIVVHHGNTKYPRHKYHLKQHSSSLERYPRQHGEHQMLVESSTKHKRSGVGHGHIKHKLVLHHCSTQHPRHEYHLQQHHSPPEQPQHRNMKRRRHCSRQKLCNLRWKLKEQRKLDQLKRKQQKLKRLTYRERILNQRERERSKQNRLEQEKLEKMRLKQLRHEGLRFDKMRREEEKLEQQKLKQQRLEQERLAKEHMERKRLEQERLAQRQLEKARLRQERLAQLKQDQQPCRRNPCKRRSSSSKRFEKELLKQQHRQGKRLERERYREKRFFQKQRLINKKRLQQERFRQKHRLAKMRLRQKLHQKRPKKSTRSRIDGKVLGKVKDIKKRLKDLEHKTDKVVKKSVAKAKQKAVMSAKKQVKQRTAKTMRKVRRRMKTKQRTEKNKAKMKRKEKAEKNPKKTPKLSLQRMLTKQQHYLQLLNSKPTPSNPNAAQHLEAQRAQAQNRIKRLTIMLEDSQHRMQNLKNNLQNQAAREYSTAVKDIPSCQNADNASVCIEVYDSNNPNHKYQKTLPIH